MHNNPIRAALCAAALFSVAAAGPVHAAALTLSDLQGAWLGQETGCQTVFSFSGGKPALKRPADAFVPAFIVAGDKLTTPLASCRSPEDGRNGERHTRHNGLRELHVISPSRDSLRFWPRLPAANIKFRRRDRLLQPLLERVNRRSATARLCQQPLGSAPTDFRRPIRKVSVPGCEPLAGVHLVRGVPRDRRAPARFAAERQRA